MADLSKMTDWTKLTEMLQEKVEQGKERKIDQKELADFLKTRVKGQDHVIDDLSQLLYRQMAKSVTTKPIASVLFLGDTGTGKTELAKALTEYFFDDPKAMVRFDFSELDSKHSKWRLIGSPVGYQGWEQGGELTRPVLANARRLILFDEIDKADASVFDLFLQLLGEGRLTEQGSGKTADFTQCIVVMTSNKEAEKIAALQEQVSDHYEMVNAVKSHLAEAGGMRPEILGRIDRIYVFRKLGEMVVAEIILMRIAELAKNYGLTVHYVAPELLLQAITSNTKIAKFGMRALNNIIEDMFAGPMVEARVNKVRIVNLAVNAAGALEITPAVDE